MFVPDPVIQFPMPEPEFSPDSITYTCPLGCGWALSATPPGVTGLDQFVHTSRMVVSDHYRRHHGVEDL